MLKFQTNIMYKAIIKKSLYIIMKLYLMAFLQETIFVYTFYNENI